MRNKKIAKQLYLYNIGCSTYEESQYIQLSHFDKFTQKEFENIVINSAVNILMEYEKSDKVTFQQILYDIVDALIQNFGFCKVKFSAQVDTFGWANIFDEKDWMGDRDDFLKRLTSALSVERGLKDAAKGKLRQR